MFIRLLTAVGALAVLTTVHGPDMAVVTERAVASGRQDGLRTVGGITAGLLVWGVLAVAGLVAVLAASTTAYAVVRLVGAASSSSWVSRRCVRAVATGRRRRKRRPPPCLAATPGGPV